MRVAARSSRAAIVQGSFHHHLVQDVARVKAYRRVIRSLVKPGDVVADLGAGSGILAAFAAEAGASRVHAVEANRHTFPLLEGFVRANHLESVVRPIHDDAETWMPPGSVDVVLCEMMETGLMSEDQARVMNRVHNAWPAKPRVVIPERAECRLALAAAPASAHGMRILLPHFEREEANAARVLTTHATYLDADFRGLVPVRANAEVRIEGLEEGTANAVLLTTRTHVGAGVLHDGSPDHASPLVLPLEEEVGVRPGDSFRVLVRYELGSVTGGVELMVMT